MQACTPGMRAAKTLGALQRVAKTMWVSWSHKEIDARTIVGNQAVSVQCNAQFAAQAARSAAAMASSLAEQGPFEGSRGP